MLPIGQHSPISELAVASGNGDCYAAVHPDGGVRSGMLGWGDAPVVDEQR